MQDKSCIQQGNTIQLQKRRFPVSYNAGTKDFIALYLSPGTLLVQYPLIWATDDNSTRRKFHHSPFHLWNGKGACRYWQSPEVIPEQFQSKCFPFLLQESFFSLRSKTFPLKEAPFCLHYVKTFCSDFYRAEEINKYFRSSPRDIPQKNWAKRCNYEAVQFYFLSSCWLDSFFVILSISVPPHQEGGNLTHARMSRSGKVK